MNTDRDSPIAGDGSPYDEPRFGSPKRKRSWISTKGRKSAHPKQTLDGVTDVSIAPAFTGTADILTDIPNRLLKTPISKENNTKITNNKTHSNTESPGVDDASTNLTDHSSFADGSTIIGNGANNSGIASIGSGFSNSPAFLELAFQPPTSAAFTIPNKIGNAAPSSSSSSSSSAHTHAKRSERTTRHRAAKAGIMGGSSAAATSSQPLSTRGSARLSSTGRSVVDDTSTMDTSHEEDSDVAFTHVQDTSGDDSRTHGHTSLSSPLPSYNNNAINSQYAMQSIFSGEKGHQQRYGPSGQDSSMRQADVNRLQARREFTDSGHDDEHVCDTSGVSVSSSLGLGSDSMDDTVLNTSVTSSLNSSMMQHMPHLGIGTPSHNDHSNSSVKGNDSIHSIHVANESAVATALDSSALSSISPVISSSPSSFLRDADGEVPVDLEMRTHMEGRHVHSGNNRGNSRGILDGPDYYTNSRLDVGMQLGDSASLQHYSASHVEHSEYMHRMTGYAASSPPIEHDIISRNKHYNSGPPREPNSHTINALNGIGSATSGYFMSGDRGRSDSFTTTYGGPMYSTDPSSGRPGSALRRTSSQDHDESDIDKDEEEDEELAGTKWTHTDGQSVASRLRFTPLGLPSEPSSPAGGPNGNSSGVKINSQNVIGINSTNISGIVNQDNSDMVGPLSSLNMHAAGGGGIGDLGIAGLSSAVHLSSSRMQYDNDDELEARCSPVLPHGSSSFEEALSHASNSNNTRKHMDNIEHNNEEHFSLHSSLGPRTPSAHETWDRLGLQAPTPRGIGHEGLAVGTPLSTVNSPGNYIASGNRDNYHDSINHSCNGKSHQQHHAVLGSPAYSAFNVNNNIGGIASSSGRVGLPVPIRRQSNPGGLSSLTSRIDGSAGTGDRTGSVPRRQSWSMSSGSLQNPGSGPFSPTASFDSRISHTHHQRGTSSSSHNIHIHTNGTGSDSGNSSFVDVLAMTSDGHESSMDDGNSNDSYARNSSYLDDGTAEMMRSGGILGVSSSNSSNNSSISVLNTSRPLPDQSAFDRSTGTKFVDQSSASPVCPATPMRTPTWSHDSDRGDRDGNKNGISGLGTERGGIGFSSAQDDFDNTNQGMGMPALMRQNSLKASKLLLSANDNITGNEADTSVDFHRDFVDEGVLGSGTFADVYRVRQRATNELYAVKKSKRQFRSKKDREWLLFEVKSMKIVGAQFCEYLIQLVRAWQENGYFYVQVELAERGTLKDTLIDLSLQGRCMPDSTVWHVLHDVSSGLAHIHACGMVHLDIKPANLLVTHSGIVKIGDFGMAAPVGRGQDGREGDTRYMAPELLESSDRQTPADVFSLGLTLYELCLPVTPPEDTEHTAMESDNSHFHHNLHNLPAALIQVGSCLPSEGLLWHILREGKAQPLHGRPSALQNAIVHSMAPRPNDRAIPINLANLPEALQVRNTIDEILSRARPRMISSVPQQQNFGSGSSSHFMQSSDSLTAPQSALDLTLLAGPNVGTGAPSSGMNGNANASMSSSSIMTGGNIGRSSRVTGLGIPSGGIHVPPIITSSANDDWNANRMYPPGTVGNISSHHRSEPNTLLDARVSTPTGDYTGGVHFWEIRPLEQPAPTTGSPAAVATMSTPKEKEDL